MGGIIVGAKNKERNESKGVELWCGVDNRRKNHFLSASFTFNLKIYANMMLLFIWIFFPPIFVFKKIVGSGQIAEIDVLYLYVAADGAGPAVDS